MPVASRIPTGHADLRPDWRAFTALVETISRGLAAQPNTAALEISAMDGSRIGAVGLGDVRRKLAATSWALGTRDPRNGGLGAIRSRYHSGWRPAAWQSGEARFHVQGFREYAALGQGALAYLALHELAHVTRLGLLVQNACWRLHLRAGGERNGAAYAETEGYIYNEQVANEIARRLAAHIGVALLTNPTFGFPPRALKLGVRT